MLYEVITELFETSEGVFTERVDKIEAEYKSNETVMRIIEFIRTKKEKGNILKTKENN